MNLASNGMVIATSITLVLYAAAVLYFVIRGARKTKSMSDYAVGSIAFSPVVVGLSLATGTTSAATFIINPGFAAYYGLSAVIATVVILPIAMLISLTVLTKGFRKHGKAVKATTLPQWMATRFQSKFLGRFFGVLNLLLVTFIVLICVGLSQILSKALNVDPVYVLVIATLFVFGYMMFGGANSMVYTNTIQGVLMLVVAVILLGSGYEHFSGGVHGFLDKLAAIDPHLIGSTNPESPFFRDMFEVLLCPMVVGVAIVCQPHIITRSLLLKTDKDVNRFLVVAIAAQALFFLVVIAGLYARLSFPQLASAGEKLGLDAIMSAYVVQELPVYLAVLVVLGMIGAALSTLENLVQSVSTSITQDLLVPIVDKHLPAEEERRSKTLVYVNRGVVAVLCVISIILSYQQLVSPKVSVAIFAQNGVYLFFAAAFFPVLVGTFSSRSPKAAAIAASVTAVVVFAVSHLGGIGPHMDAPVKNPSIPTTLAILCAVAVGVATLALRRQRASDTEPVGETTPAQ